MARVERNVVKPPNQKLQGPGSNKSATPRAHVALAGGPNAALRSGDPGGSANLTRQPSPVPPVNHRFNVDEAQMPQPPAAVEPGHGAIPVNPGLEFRPAVVPADLLPHDAK
jgi:hypothetical protein